jgi:hypothetical protein
MEEYQLFSRTPDQFNGEPVRTLYRVGDEVSINHKGLAEEMGVDPEGLFRVIGYVDAIALDRGDDIPDEQTALNLQLKGDDMSVVFSAADDELLAEFLDVESFPFLNEEDNAFFIDTDPDGLTWVVSYYVDPNGPEDFTLRRVGWPDDKWVKWGDVMPEGLPPQAWFDRFLPGDTGGSREPDWHSMRGKEITTDDIS